jgi:hypothetical protein
MPLKPKRGGFVRPFSCGWFIREFIMGHGPNESPVIDQHPGAPHSDIFHHYKIAIIKATATDRATRFEEKLAKKEKISIDPGRIEVLIEKYLALMPYKAKGCRYHSFITYSSNLIRLGWVEPTGKEERSAFQENYQQGQPRRYYRLTQMGIRAGELPWLNPRVALYGPSHPK